MSHLLNGHCARLSLILSATSNTADVQRYCPRCKQARPFASSGKFRVNAQKKLIDIWLIYRCATCDQIWNHTIHERKSVRSLPPAELEAYMRNDAGLSQHHAGLLSARLGAAATAGDIRVARQVLAPMEKASCRLDIGIVAMSGNSLRLDRVLAMGLTLGRGDIAELAESGALVVAGASIKALRRPALNGQQVEIDLRSCPAGIADICREITRQ